MIIRNSKTKKIKGLRIALLLICCLILSIFIIQNNKSSDLHYEKIDISPLLQKEILQEDDYTTLFYQTGLGKSAIDTIRKQENADQAMYQYQKNFFHPPKSISKKLNPITKQDVFVDKDENTVFGFTLAPIEEGYILLTKSTYTLTYRHGHAAIVVDKEKGLILEAFSMGENSGMNHINNWTQYDSFMMLKLKDTSVQAARQIATYAKENLMNLPYNLFTGLIKKFPPIDRLQSTHCSQLVWYPFMAYGYDIDSTGGNIVTPRDIANSPLFEIVQIYGFHPSTLWK
ncbi:hypothetical protein [Brevibacillus daliensis]|uniref:hypothetical protein n=1 Tax=Brevibacillus daliensis TaxID=2892995 RepID=UPI001E46CFEF|nr:hypothetical protein [Brevibacillus daliensis]